MSARVPILSVSAALAIVHCSPVFAQAGGVQPGDIIVTARKREETILQVPVVASVVSQEQLLKYQITEISDLQTKVPGMIFSEAPLNNGTQVAIRGAGTSALNSGIDQTVVLNFDGMQLSQGVAYRAGLFDVGQVEVLKGPQALFYGKSSTGGVISIRSADPTDELEIIGRASYGFETDEKRDELIMSGPLTEQLLARLAGSYSRDDGYFKNTAVAAPGTGAVTPSTKDIVSKHLILRGTLLFEPSSDFKARLKVNYAYDNVLGDGGNGQLVTCPEGVGRAFQGRVHLGGNEDCKLDRKFNVVWADPAAFPIVERRGRVGEITRQAFGTLELNYNLAPRISLTSVSGYYQAKSKGILNAASAAFAAPGFFAGGGGFERTDFTQEFRIDTDFAGPLNFSGGVYYQDAWTINRLATPGNILYGLPAVLGVPGEHNTDTEAYSAYGQLRYRVAPEFEIAAGVRWTNDKRRYEAVTFVSGQTVPLPVAVNKLVNDNLSPELTLTWTPTDDLTVFGSLKQAYKSGSFTNAGLPRAGEDPSFKEERVRGGEIGIKGRLADRQLTFDLAGYYYKYKDLQVSGIDQPRQGEQRTPTNRLLNAAGAKIYGVEFAATYAPAQLEGLSINAAVNFNHARFTDFIGAPCWGGQFFEEGCDQIPNPLTVIPNQPERLRYTAQDLSGGRLLRAPTWQLQGGFDYKFDLSDTLKMSVGSDSRYSSSFLNSLAYRFDSFTDGNFQTDLTVTLGDKNDAWEIAAGARNLTNKLVKNSCSVSNVESVSIFVANISGALASLVPRSPLGFDETTCRVDPGRQVWVRLTLRPTRL